MDMDELDYFLYMEKQEQRQPVHGLGCLPHVVQHAIDLSRDAGSSSALFYLVFIHEGPPLRSSGVDVFVVLICAPAFGGGADRFSVCIDDQSLYSL